MSDFEKGKKLTPEQERAQQEQKKIEEKKEVETKAVKALEGDEKKGHQENPDALLAICGNSKDPTKGREGSMVQDYINSSFSKEEKETNKEAIEKAAGNLETTVREILASKDAQGKPLSPNERKRRIETAWRDFQKNIDTLQGRDEAEDSQRTEQQSRNIQQEQQQSEQKNHDFWKKTLEKIAQMTATREQAQRLKEMGKHDEKIAKSRPPQAESPEGKKNLDLVFGP